MPPELRPHLEGDHLWLPALATAHSHAFQRALRGRAQRPGPAGTDDFWTWRHAMYELAASLTPETIHDLSLVAYRELHAAGVRTVGEFHYVHHQPDGAPYGDRTVLAEAVIAAARAAGLRIALLRVIYARGGPGRPAEGAQLRFRDLDVDHALADIEALCARYAGDPQVRIGVAPHSVRAVPPAWLRACAEHAARHGLPLHMHVAEQPAEVEACLSETGRRPVELLAEQGVLGERFVAVHATHLAPHEASLLGGARAKVCLCPTTERDLGDGLPDVGALRAADVELSWGIDSHVLTDPFEELRGIELGERLRTLRRVTDRRPGATPAARLWAIGSTASARACGFDDAGGRIALLRRAPALALVDDEHLLDAVVFSGSPALVAHAAHEPG